MDKLNFESLPVITEDIADEFYDEPLMRFNTDEDPQYKWTQTAADFANLVRGNLADRIKELESELSDAIECIENSGVDWHEIQSITKED